MRNFSLIACVVLVGVACSNQDTNPAPFEQVQLQVTQIKNGDGLVPWAMRFSMNGTLFYTVRNVPFVEIRSMNVTTGEIKIHTSSAAVRTNTAEAGVLGLELDKNFLENKWIYICYSYWKDGTQDLNSMRNRVSRFTFGEGGLYDEVILLDNMLGGLIHNGCRLTIGPDGKLYISMGDAGNTTSPIFGEPDGPAKAQSLNLLAGKIFRINLDGTVPTDNPFYTQLSGSARAIYSFGHRNPQGLAFQPTTGLLWSTEHGENTRDELNVIRPGKNYGWPHCVGVQNYGVKLIVPEDLTTYPCLGVNLSVSNYQKAAKEYLSTSTIAIGDAVFYDHDFIPQLRGNLLFLTLKTQRMYRVQITKERVTNEEILISGVGEQDFYRLRAIAVAPDGKIYISNDNGFLYKIEPKVQ